MSLIIRLRVLPVVKSGVFAILSLSGGMEIGIDDMFCGKWNLNDIN